MHACRSTLEDPTTEADFARELTAPLSVASRYAEELGRDELAMTNGRARVDMARILSSCRQTRSLLDGLLTIVRLQRNGPRPERAVVDPCEMLHEAVRRNTPLLLDKSLALGATAHQLPVVRLDRGAVDTVIDNLIAALVPRVRCGSQIWTAMHRHDADLCLRISIDAQPDDATISRPHDPIPRQMGSSIGLAFVVASRIVELLGGRIELDETGSDRAWRVRLPA